MKALNLILISLIIFMVSCNSKKKDGTQIDNDFVPNVALTQDEIDKGILTPEILWKFGRISDPQLSPDKKTIVYNITHYDVEKNRGFTNIYTIPAGGGAVKRLTGGENAFFNPRWSKDGSKIIYLSTETENVQLWAMNVDGSDKTQISELDKSINSFKISPNGDKILFMADVKLENNPQDIYPDLPNTNVVMADDLMYRHWNAWTDDSYSHIFIADFDEKSLQNIYDIMKDEKFDAPMSPYFDDSEITWSTDGKKIAYTCKKMSGKDYAVSTDSDIYLYDLETKSTTNLTEGMLGYDKYPVFSPDSKYLAWISMETPGYEADKERLFIMNLETKEKEYLTEHFDYGASNVVWPQVEGNYDNLYFISCFQATHQIFKINYKTREVVQITEGDHDITSIKWNGNGFIAEKMSIKSATEIFTFDQYGKETQITFTNKHIYDNIAVSDYKEVWVPTTDGKEMLTWVILPPNFDETKEYPAILFCLGGPQSAMSQFFSYRWNFQIMAANGYVVIAPNRRGVIGFGSEWCKQISGDYGGQNMKDYMSAVNYVKKESYVDEDRIGAVGASYGGFSVFWLAGHNQDKTFKAFISHCGMYNLESQYAATEEMFFVNYDLGGAYWEKDNKKAQSSYANSPHNFVQNWNTPILIISGGYDFRIPYTESLQAFNAAQLMGVESKLLIFPEETHFVLKPQNSILWQREFKAWLDKYL
ncbi:MAG TPA: S9 family peptidase [Bacteroidales bacterium]|nr:S9 family peptidase [Bacteroidales bacterium]HQB21726.1 S9 family peptidase [Bacteroidales bacterium]